MSISFLATIMVQASLHKFLLMVIFDTHTNTLRRLNGEMRITYDDGTDKNHVEGRIRTIPPSIRVVKVKSPTYRVSHSLGPHSPKIRLYDHHAEWEVKPQRTIN